VIVGMVIPQYYHVLVYVSGARSSVGQYGVTAVQEPRILQFALKYVFERAFHVFGARGTEGK
jgi:hypothetical protein